MNAYVTIPIAGSINVYLEDIDEDATDDELFDAAIEAADVEYHNGKTTEWGEVEYLRRIVSGNVMWGSVNDFSVERD